MALVNRGELEIGYRDFNNQSTSLTIFRPQELDAGDIVAYNVASAAIAAAFDAITLGQRNRFVQANLANVQVPYLRSTNPLAQKHVEWRIHMLDNVTNRPFSYKIGTADLAATGALLPGTKLADMTADVWVDIKTTLEASSVSPLGNAVTVIGAELIEP